MDFAKLMPDFNAIGKTNWAKPQFDTKDLIGLAGIIAAGIMIVLVFTPWFGYEVTGFRGLFSESSTRFGITLWYGILGFIVAIATLACHLYNHKALALWCSTFCLLMGLIGLFAYSDVTRSDGYITTAEVIKYNVARGSADTIRWGVILYFLFAMLSAASAFMTAMNIKIKK